MALSAPTRRAVLPYALLAIALALTAAAALSATRTADSRARLRFDNAAIRMVAAIDGHLDAYIALLLGGAGLFAASDTVQLTEFRAYFERLELSRRYPGIQGIGFSRLVHPEDREAIAADVRRHVPSFRYWPEAPPDRTVHAIVYLEPHDERNLVAFGYDMFAEPTRQKAMVRARDTASPAATRRVVLVQEIDPDQQQFGFLIYVPVYGGGPVPDTVEQRRERLLGFVYSPFRADDLLQGIAGRAAVPGVSFDVFDGPPGDRRLLHRGVVPEGGALFETEQTISMAGQQWTLVLRAGPDFITPGRGMVRLLSVGGVLLAFLLFAATMTEVRARASAERTAEGLRRSEEVLRQANRAKDEFLAIVSHELRTPLNAILGWAAMMKRGHVAPEGLARALEVIERNASAQAHLVDDLLDISLAVAGRLRLELTSVDVASTLNAAADSVRPSASAHGVTLDNRLPPALGTIRADQARLQQVVLNLLANAIKFTPRGGQVTLEAARENGGVKILVSDTGIGIAPEFLPFVFDRFRQADTSTTRTYGGVGLGLAIVRHLVELHGGSVVAASEGHDRGATFTVRLPEAPFSSDS